jgi:regulatory protein
MSGTITELKFQQRNKERVNIYLDGEFAFGLDAVEAAKLRKGQVLSDDEISALRAQDERNRAFNRAVRFLRYRPRSQVEVERNLREKGVADQVISAVVERLERAGYLDDEAFARFWVENREQFKPRGRRALRHELRQKGVGDRVIAQVLEGIDEEAAAWRAIEGRMQQWRTLDRDQLRKKLMGYLSRRGFNYEIISIVFEKACHELTIED